MSLISGEEIRQESARREETCPKGMKYDGNSKEIVFDDNTRLNVSAFVPNDAILESVAYDEEEKDLTLYVRLMTSIKSININYKVV